jgi:hypothetical protein
MDRQLIALVVMGPGLRRDDVWVLRAADRGATLGELDFISPPEQIKNNLASV